MKLKEIADRIDAHLRRFEKDPKINIRRRFNKATGKWEDDPTGFGAYYMARAYVGGSRVGVRYVSYQGNRTLTKDEAIRYLAWLDAGNVGTHHQVPKDWSPE